MQKHPTLELLRASQRSFRQSRAKRRKSRGQAALEFALVAPIAIVILLAAVQMALIGQIDVALGQANYQGARFASLHPDCSVTSCSNGETAPYDSIQDYVYSVMSPTINPAKLTITATPAPTRTTGQTVQVSLVYDVSGQLFLPQNFMGIISFPTSLTSIQSAMSQ